MELQIVSKKENPLLKRKRFSLLLCILRCKTPARLDIKRSIASQLQVSDKLVFVKQMHTMTGTNKTVGKANAYETEAQAKQVEPTYIIKRNTPPEKSKEEATA